MKGFKIESTHIEEYTHLHPKPGKQYIPHVEFSYWNKWGATFEGGPHPTKAKAQQAMDEFIKSIKGHDKED